MSPARISWNPALSALLFCALLLRIAVPAGFMIGTAADGAPALLLCPQADSLTIVAAPHDASASNVIPAEAGISLPFSSHHPAAHAMPMPATHHHHDPTTHADGACPYAALAAPALPPAPPAIFAATAILPPPTPASIPNRSQRPGPAAPPPPATGPPFPA